MQNWKQHLRNARDMLKKYFFEPIMEQVLVGQKAKIRGNMCIVQDLVK